MLTRILYFYDKHIYSRFKERRGFTRVRNVLKGVSGPYVCEVEKNGYSASFSISRNWDRNYFLEESLDDEDEVIGEILSEIEGSEVFYDVGSKSGGYAFLVADKLEDGDVYAFEPDPYNLTHLVDNNRLNNGIVHVVGAALSDGVGTQSMEINPNTYASHLSEESSDEYISGLFSVDFLVSEGYIPEPDILKIDIEGAEMKLLQGMEDVLDSEELGPRLIYCEVHPENMEVFGDSYEELEDFLKDFGYEITEFHSRDEQFYVKIERG